MTDNAKPAVSGTVRGEVGECPWCGQTMPETPGRPLLIGERVQDGDLFRDPKDGKIHELKRGSVFAWAIGQHVTKKHMLFRRGTVAATDGGDGAPEASPATTPGGAPCGLEPRVPHIHNARLDRPETAGRKDCHE